MRTLVVATTNKGKLREIAELLVELPVDVASLERFPDAPDVDEPHDTFAENAARKATIIARETGVWAIADDSGLEVEALGGEPGVKSARVAPTDPERIAWLLERMRDVPEGSRQARFVCCIALASPEGLVGSWEESVEGVITREPAGEHGFGFDPVFLYEPAGKTFAQLIGTEKGQVSHRGKALRMFRRAFGEMLDRRLAESS